MLYVPIDRSVNKRTDVFLDSEFIDAYEDTSVSFVILSRIMLATCPQDDRA